LRLGPADISQIGALQIQYAAQCGIRNSSVQMFLSGIIVILCSFLFQDDCDRTIKEMVQQRRSNEQL
jgi:hypothetical protein